jgi:hypothetical protein
MAVMKNDFFNLLQAELKKLAQISPGEFRTFP